MERLSQDYQERLARFRKNTIEIPSPKAKDVNKSTNFISRRDFGDEMEFERESKNGIST